MNWLERLQKINEIYSRLEDEESRYIFEKRLEHLLVRFDEVNFWNEIKGESAWRCPNEKDHFIIFGAGELGGYYLDVLETTGKHVDAFCDNSKEGYVLNKPVLSVKEAVKTGKPVIVPYGRYTNEMARQLKEEGIAEDLLLYEPDIRSYTGRQYFDVWDAGENEILVDCGAYDGDTIRDFIDWTGRKYEKIYAFEPSSRNYEKCIQYLKENKIENVDVINKATWNSDTTLKFESYSYDTGDHIVDLNKTGQGNGGCEVIEAASIDSVLAGKKATFIKMDVEGSEMESLAGAQETIKKYKPRLAIAVYHKSEDIFDIPLYILQLNGTYKFKMRHYSSCSCETVLYAE